MGLGPPRGTFLREFASRSKRSKASLGSEVITAYGETNEWQSGEILAGIADADARNVISRERVARWLRSWGKPAEGKAPR